MNVNTSPTHAALLSKQLNNLSEAIYQENKAKGFWPLNRNVGEALMLIVSELAEGIEAHRAGRHANIEEYENVFQSIATEQADPSGDLAHECAFKAHIKDSFEDEMADAIIRILDLCGGLGIDIGKHVFMKLQYNANRPHKHGKAY
jgi:NTP pyrophosphatase (non-canonical NTP hydrolase)